MKHTHFRIENGIVVKCSPFDPLNGAIRAKTKAEATALFLHRAEEITKNLPHVYVENGAFLIVSHNGNGWIAESGRIPETTPNGAKRLNSSCLSSYDTFQQAIKDKTFAYYASADYQRVRGNQLASLTPERIESAKASQALSDAECERLANQAESENAARECADR